MKKLSVIFGLVVVAAVLISFNAEGKNKFRKGNAINTLFADVVNPFEEALKKQAEVISLNPSTDLNVVEVEEDVDLGIEVEAYLPFGFNAYKGFQLDIADIKVIELEEEVELGFDVNQYLPADFNPYKA